MKIKVEIIVIVQIMLKMSNIKINKIDDYKNIILCEFFSAEKYRIIKKIEKAKEKNKREINISLSLSQSSAIYHWLIDCKDNNRYDFAFVAGEIHKQLINNVSKTYFEARSDDDLLEIT